MKIKKICICFLAIISILFLKNYCQAQSIVYNTTDFKIVGTELIEYTGNEEDIIVPQNVKKIPHLHPQKDYLHQKSPPLKFRHSTISSIDFFHKVCYNRSINWS